MIESILIFIIIQTFAQLTMFLLIYDSLKQKSSEQISKLSIDDRISILEYIDNRIEKSNDENLFKYRHVIENLLFLEATSVTIDERTINDE